jgi:hypothetical protein
MSEELKDGGPAFPKAEYSSPGISIRDYFAAKAMPSIYESAINCGFEVIAELAYEIADAMIKARKS